MTLKYFEIHDPYYAMIKAQDQTQAIETYVEYVSYDEDGTLNDEIKEINRDIALIMYSRGSGEGLEKMRSAELLEEFNREESAILLITSELV